VASSDDPPPQAPEFQVGDAFVRVDHTTTQRLYGMREFTFRVRRAGKVGVYRADVPIADVAGMNQKQLAEYMLQRLAGVPRAEELFSYLDASDP
jgi:hypothetical protein